MGAKRRYPVVTITWIDITSCSGWQDVDAHQQTLEMESTGYLLPSKRPDVYRIAQTLVEDGHVGEVLVIPRSVVKKFRRG